jgi:hypothetical protein
MTALIDSLRTFRTYIITNKLWGPGTFPCLAASQQVMSGVLQYNVLQLDGHISAYNLAEITHLPMKKSLQSRVENTPGRG